MGARNCVASASVRYVLSTGGLWHLWGACQLQAGKGRQDNAARWL